MDSRPALACVSLRWGKRNKEHETSACEPNASGRLLVEVTRLFQWRHGAVFRHGRILDLYAEKLISFQRGLERR